MSNLPSSSDNNLFNMRRLQQISDNLVNNFNSRFGFNYARMISTYPFTVMVVTSFISICLTCITFKYTDLPSFSDPKLGFETRHTKLSGRVLTYRNLDKEISFYPDNSKRFFRQIYGTTNFLNDFKKRSAEINDNENSTEKPAYCQHNNIYLDQVDEYVQLVLEAKSLDDLFSVETQRELCNLQSYILQRLDSLSSVREVDALWSLPNYLSCSTEALNCFHLNQTLLTQEKDKIEYCGRYKSAIISCFSDPTNRLNVIEPKNKDCFSIPIKCRMKYYYDTFYFLLSKNVGGSNQTTTSSVHTIFVLPVKTWKTFKLLDYKSIYFDKLLTLQNEVEEFTEENLKRTKYVGRKFEIKLNLFSNAFLADSVDVLIGLGLVSLIIWIYTGSLFYTISVLLTLGYSLGLSYFVYRLVFRIDFFPFINLLVVVILVGIGGDDTFVLRHIFDLYKKQGQVTIAGSDISEPLSNAALSMFVTSVTTAAAFFSNVISDVIVIKCFGLFAGTMMLMNYLLVVSWLPASVIFIDRLIEPIYLSICPKKILVNVFKIRTLVSIVPNYVMVDSVMPWLVTKLKYVLILLFGGLFVASACVVFYYPRLSLPNRNLMKMFKDDNPFEWYDSKIEDYFEFPSIIHKSPIDIAIVWGFTPDDNSYALDPWDTGYPTVDSKFNLTLPTLQMISYACELLDNVNVTSVIDHDSCFPRQFLEWSFAQNCKHDPSDSKLEVVPTPCCNYIDANFRETDIGYCLAQSTKLDGLIEYGHPIFDSAAYFNEGKFKVVGMAIYFDTQFDKIYPYEKLDSFYRHVESDFSNVIHRKISDDSVQKAWFVTVVYDILGQYDLETSLLNKTPLMILISVVVTLLVVVLSTKTILLSLLCIITISAIIIVTVACLILLKWKLNIVESIIIVLTVGLSMDIPAHYAVGYKLAPRGTRNEKIFATLAYIGIPTFCCAFTTFLAGLAMLRVVTMAYYQTGLFMMINGVIAWIYTNLFFLPLLSCFGPQDVGCTSWTMQDIWTKVQKIIEQMKQKQRTATPTVAMTTISTL